MKVKTLKDKRTTNTSTTPHHKVEHKLEFEPNLQFLLDRHQFSVGNPQNCEDSEEEEKFSADQFVKRTLKHALIVTFLSLSLTHTIQHAGLACSDAANLLLLGPRHELSVYEGQYYVGQHEQGNLAID